MPELPEVEVIKRELEPAVRGKVFSTPRLIFPGSVRFPSPDEFSKRLPGRRIAGLDRRGKYLIFDLDPGILLVHLRMTGRLLFFDERRANLDYPHLRLVLPFDDRTALYFSDMRKFGGIWLCLAASEHPAGFSSLGPDIYRQVDRSCFAQMLEKHPLAMIKPLLLNQCVFSGLGNIYTDESLYLSSIHPRRPAGTLTTGEIDRLYEAIGRLLKQGIESGGASVRDFRDAGDQKGGFQNYLEVYGRQGEPCRRCGTTLARTTVGGRGTYFCPACQKEV